MIKAVSLAIEVDLQRFSQFLRSQGISHRISEESGQQVIWVEGPQQAGFVKHALDNWSFEQAPQEEPRAPDQLNKSHSGTASALISSILIFYQKFVFQFRASPISILLIITCLIVAVLSGLGSQSQRVGWLFYPLISSSDLFSLMGDINTPGVLIRSFTPMFLHFGELHLVFNMLWLWFFGKQLEVTHPRMLFIALILITSFSGNTTQYLYSHYNNFGGMSGVVYGLVSYTWLIHRFMPRSHMLINNNMFVVFVVALIVMEVVASSWIASAAHVGGLVSGLLFGAGVVAVYRFVLHRDSIMK
ncbi:MAG: hypothetical protein COA96_00175 [SAR86 cluster bacterium]|uniref:Rhomboid family intramembrane serine protease n=1 Tax=SAR86 cluster bacterium TaxID=2030880 RepID=A0A2A5BBU5_9GAMM|nr:MAG: hypothetical protein COA96_00175 [SAR86 cluster bacterium]